MRRRLGTAPLWALVMLAGFGCGDCGGPASSDAGAPEHDVDAGAVEYSGPTQGGVLPELPDVPRDGGFVYDSGPAPDDEPCCMATYRIRDEEPDDATGALVGEHAAFGDGVPLAREDGYWSAEVCIPLDVSFAYHFEFTTTVEAEGEELLPDGGTQTTTVEVPLVEQRASAAAPVYYDDDGEPYNVQDAVASCDELAGNDAGTPEPDAGSDPRVDAGSDPSVDAGSDGGVDAGADGEGDAGSGSEGDAGSDPSVDAGSDGGVDAGSGGEGDAGSGGDGDASIG